MLRISPITTRKRSSYKNMHNKAFPTNKLGINAYKKIHQRAFPTSPKGLSLKSYQKMHKLAFPSPKGTRRSRS
jgi:hypothetical protein